jgi:hypothetical protein
MACVLVLAFLGWHGAIAGACLGAGRPAGVDEGEEDAPDMNYVTTQAEAGRAGSQTQLADFYLASADFTNAVIWYRQAANQGHVPAQLSLAGCLMSGRGAAKDRAGAAKLLRQAADLIEFQDGFRGTAASPAPSAPAAARTVTKVAARSIVITKETLASPSNAPARLVLAPPHLPPVVAVQTNATRIGRVDSLAATEAVLQEVRPLGPPADSPP